MTTAEDVATELVDAEGMGEAHARQRNAGSHLAKAIGRQPRPHRRKNCMRDQNDRAEIKAERARLSIRRHDGNRARVSRGAAERVMSARHGVAD
jgi:hypothetical protein